MSDADATLESLPERPADYKVAPPPVHEALSMVMGHVQAVGKTERNTQQNFNFRGIDAVVNAVGPALRHFGVLVLPKLLSVEYGAFTTKGGTAMHTCSVDVEYRFVGPAGDELTCSAPGYAADAGDKATPKAMSVAFRTALLQALCIPTDEPDADQFTYERAGQVEPMTGTQFATIAGNAAKLTDEHRAAFNQWWKDSRLPRKERLSGQQADLALDKLDELLRADAEARAERERAEREAAEAAEAARNQPVFEDEPPADEPPAEADDKIDWAEFVKSVGVTQAEALRVARRAADVAGVAKPIKLDDLTGTLRAAVVTALLAAAPQPADEAPASGAPAS